MFAIFIQDGVPQCTVQQYDDNLRWLREAEKHKMVVGSQARILYSDQLGRVKIALAFNNAVKNGTIKVRFQINCIINHVYRYNIENEYIKYYLIVMIVLSIDKIHK